MYPRFFDGVAKLNNFPLFSMEMGFGIGFGGKKRQKTKKPSII
jgi:hypothetical protein